MARKTKYTPELVKTITDALGMGATIKDACALAGISHETYFTWVNEKSDFSDATTHAQSNARFAATLAIRKAVQGGAQQTSETVENVTETRLRKGANGEQVPYEYAKTQRSTTTTKYPPDWRAGVEYLKRRDPEHWSERLQVSVDVKVIMALVDTLTAIGENPESVFNRLLEAARKKQLANGGANE